MLSFLDPTCDSFSDVFSVDYLITSFGWGDSDDMWKEIRRTVTKSCA